MANGWLMPGWYIRNERMAHAPKSKFLVLPNPNCSMGAWNVCTPSPWCGEIQAAQPFPPGYQARTATSAWFGGGGLSASSACLPKCHYGTKEII